MLNEILLPIFYQLSIGFLTADVVPFITLFLLNNGYNMSKVGLILAIANIFSFLTCLVLSRTNKDDISQNKFIYTILTLLSIASLIGYEFLSYQYIWICFYYIFFTPLVVFLDNYTMTSVSRSKYPRYRSFASFGWGITAASISYLLENEHVSLFFYCIHAVLSIFCVIIFKSIVYVKSNENNEQCHHIIDLKNDEDVKKSSQTIELKNIDNCVIKSEKSDLVINPIITSQKDKDTDPIDRTKDNDIIELEQADIKKISLLMLITLTYTIAMNVILYYFIVYIDEIFQGDKLVTSTRQILSIILEIPSFIFYPYIVKYIKNKYILICSVIFIIIQLCGYLIITNPWYLLIFETLHGLSFAFFWSSCLDIIYSYQNQKAIHFIFWSIFSGLGVFLALIMGGYLTLTVLFTILILINITSIILFMLFY